MAIFTKSHIRCIAVLVFVIIGGGVFVSLGVNRQQKKPDSGQNPAVCQDCNVLLVAFDALQVAHVSGFGYDKKTTPTIDAFAQEGILFHNTISAAPWTVPSFMSIFTDAYPSQHKVVNKFSLYTKDEKVVANLSKLSPNMQTLAQIFKKNGYATGGFTGDAGVGAQFGYNLGFDTYTDEVPFGSMENSAGHALDWLKTHQSQKFFLFLHGYDAHGQFKPSADFNGIFMDPAYKGPYTGTPQEQAKLREEGLANGQINVSPADVTFWRNLYDSKIYAEDSHFAAFWQEFQTLGIKNKTIVVIFADHGTEFFEHKRIDHGFSLYDELVRVPLVFVVPGLEGKRVVDEQVRTIDIAPTVLDMVGITPTTGYQSQMQGESLMPFLRETGGASRDAFIETDYREYTHKRGIRTKDGWKFILTLESNRRELYNLKDDPGETNNLIDKHPQVAFDLELRVREHMKAMGEDPYKTWGVGCVPVYQDQCQ